MSRHKGHFVQVRVEDAKPGTPWQDYMVEVEGRKILRATTNPFLAGWRNVSRELPLRKAKYYAKAYRHAGFDSRVVLVAQPHGTYPHVIVEYKKPRKH